MSTEETQYNANPSGNADVRERGHNRAVRPRLDRFRPSLRPPVRPRRIRRRRRSADHRKRARRARPRARDPRADVAPFHCAATGVGARARSRSGCGRRRSDSALAGRSAARARGMGVAGTAAVARRLVVARRAPLAHSWSRRWLLYPAFIVLGLIAVGGAFETVAEATSSNAAPLTGRTYLVDGHRLYLNCVGSGSPTVVLFNGHSARTPNWALVQSALARQTRVCAYDRAGQGWSGNASGRQDAHELAADVHALPRQGARSTRSPSLEPRT
jgi:hypothetical protein